MSNQVITFGCRLNIFESAVIEKNLKDTNLDNTIIINSCAVTSEAERQVRKAIRKSRKENPHKKIIVTGCAAQINPKKYSDLKEVDHVIGNKEKLEASTYLSLTNNKVIVNDIMELKETAAHLVNDFEGKSRAYLEIQNGCNHRCTFCIIPFGRGNNRSVPVGEIVENCKRVLDLGFREIVFTGVDITDYGDNLPGKPKLGQLVRRVLKLCPELPRLRLSSVDVAEIDDELFELMSSEKRLMPHFHISIQSGDDMILKRMKRRHNRQGIYDFVNKLKAKRDNIGFGADIITGFPTETDAMFENTRRLVTELEIPFLHIFPYSEREGTPAARIPIDKQVDKNIRKERARILRELGEINKLNFSKNQDGKLANLLVESEHLACTDNFLKIPYSGNIKPGQIITQKLSYDPLTQQLIGKEC